MLKTIFLMTGLVIASQSVCAQRTDTTKNVTLGNTRQPDSAMLAKIKAAREFVASLKGKQISEFDMQTVDGKKISLKQLKGKTIVFNFWFIACKPCIAEMPNLNKLVDTYSKRNDIVFIAPSFDSKDRLAAFLANNTFNYTVTHSAFENILRTYPFTSFPINLVVDKKGVISFLSTGSLSEVNNDSYKNFAAAIEAALKGND